ncbi:MAG TPA: HWE histidine kinase domain-containing protein [Allosphingosinicella sp.]|nr:HWE histidine kinase domain-containing protein [Allosphingosinicella sp.]
MESLREDLAVGLAAVMKTALDAVIVMRTDGIVVAWNDKAQRTFGWTGTEARGRRLSELVIPPRYREAHEQGLARFVETGEGPVLDRRIEISGLHRSGRELPVELSITFSEQFGEKLFIGFVRDITDRQEAASRQERMLRELSHRVKNMLALVAAIAQQTARSSADMAEFQDAFLGRLRSLARGHDLLVQGQWESVSIRSLAEDILGADAAAGRAEYGGSDFLLSQRQLLGLAMTFHELYTNAVKYGALSIPGGRVSLDWRPSDGGGSIEIVWKETGLDGVETPKRSGFGQKMIELSVQHDLAGDLQSEWRPEGLLIRIRFPDESAGQQTGIGS